MQLWFEHQCGVCSCHLLQRSSNEIIHTNSPTGEFQQVFENLHLQVFYFRVSAEHEHQIRHDHVTTLHRNPAGRMGMMVAV